VLGAAEVDQLAHFDLDARGLVGRYAYDIFLDGIEDVVDVGGTSPT
jgi:hypothetical protein